MKICVVIHSLGIGGMERVMSLLIRHFSFYQKAEIHLVLIGKERVIKYDLPNTVIVHRPKWEFNNKYRTLHTIRTLLFIKSTMNRIKPDTILSFGEMWNNLVLLALKNKAFPVYISDRSTPNKNLGSVQNWLRDKMYPNAAGYIAQTEKAAHVARQNNWNNNIQIIGNPVPQINAGVPEGKQILTVGRLIKTKNVDRLIEIFDKARIELNTQDWKLCVLGGNAAGGSILEELHKQVANKDLMKLVRLEGEKSNVLDYLKSSEIFAFASTSEGFPNALAEAMSAGLAVIAYDCMAGPSDLIDNGVNGFLIPEGNEEEFKVKLMELMSNQSLRASLGIAAKEKMKNFREDLLAERFYKFISSAKS